MRKTSRIVAVLRRFRELAGFTQEQMAEKTGMSVSTLQRIETGMAEMKLSQLEQYMKVLGVTLIDVELAMQKGDYILEKDIAAAARLLGIRQRRALLRFITDLRE
ncbi:helix-turn-helix transcriptional regulator [Vibrio brasiliensis]|uniref:helix-turn-helix domain-containing protein n=1 Tax=Vibrio brasiliensis TaxID=170652 RepID=UPI001EFED08D|nr:helix-turn-helix transcriptional regulator [Vibrio brasiliensis]MCG9785370.1 helix-turn-helix transcriptional regulator [Vibrio brasiliensis]